MSKSKRQSRRKTTDQGDGSNREARPKSTGGPKTAAAFFSTLWGAFTIVVTITGALIGFGIAQVCSLYIPQLGRGGEDTVLVVYFGAGLVVAAGLLFFLLSQVLFRKLIDFLTYLERVSFVDKVAAVVGVVLGLLVGYFLTAPLAAYSHLQGVRLFAMIIAVALGVAVAMSAKGQFGLIFASRPGATPAEEEADAEGKLRHKFLDTNIIIDGRIADICAAGFVEGVLFVPAFVLHELQQIADSADPLKRARGRRGLEMLERMRNDLQVPVQPYEDYPEGHDETDGVDYRLVKLAQVRDGMILTNDYNLNKIAGLHGVPVLNVNELANAVKPVFLPGDQLDTTVVKEGKEQGQGVGYLDDGTMVVVERASGLIGRTVLVTVASTYQTQAGKMIFAELAEETDIPTVSRKGKSQR